MTGIIVTPRKLSLVAKSFFLFEFSPEDLAAETVGRKMLYQDSPLYLFCSCFIDRPSLLA